MTNPREAIIPGYATKEEAYTIWAEIKDNDFYAVVGINIGFGRFKPADKNVCWIVAPNEAVLGCK